MTRKVIRCVQELDANNFVGCIKIKGDVFFHLINRTIRSINETGGHPGQIHIQRISVPIIAKNYVLPASN